MNKIDEAIDRIKILECPTGEVDSRVREILEEYGVAERSKVKIDRDDRLGRDEVQAYRVEIEDQGQSFLVLAKAGLDDYVAKVTDVLH